MVSSTDDVKLGRCRQFPGLTPLYDSEGVASLGEASHEATWILVLTYHARVAMKYAPATRFAQRSAPLSLASSLPDQTLLQKP